MSNYDIKDKNCYCSMAEYTDDMYICRYTGSQCIYKDYPNQFTCGQYRKGERTEAKYIIGRINNNA